MEETKKPQENKMGTEPINRLLLSMAVPLMLSMLVQACYNIVDSVYVAQVSEDALTAVSMAFPIQSIMIAVCSGTGVGMNAMLSRSLGEKNYEGANKAANNGVFLALCSYILFVLIGLFVARPFFMSQISYNMDIVNGGVSYMRVCCVFSLGLCMQMTFERMMQGTGLTFYTMITQMTGAIINIILDPMFIFGIGPFPELGVTGAAVATCIGQSVAAILAIILNRKFNKELYVGIHRIFSPSWSVIKRIYYVGIPSIIMASIGSVMYYGMNLILTSFSSTASAVFGVYYKLQSFFFMPVFGMNNAIVPIMAYNYGAQKRSRMLHVLKNGLIYAIVIMCVGVVAFETIPQVLLGFFNASEHMQEIGVPALRIIGIHFPVAAVCIVLGTAFQAMGKAVYSAVISLGRQLFVLLPVAYVLAQVGGLHVIWWSFPIAETVSLTLTLIFFRHLYVNTIMKVEDRV
jgi:putative MATE family efflux protein